MPRLQLTPRKVYPFACEITVRITDLNYGGHLGNDRVLSLVHEARVDFLAGQGWTELECAGVGLIMGDAAIVFKGEAYAGDVLLVETACGEPGRSGFRLSHRLTRKADGQLIALVETGMICFDYQRRRIQLLPAAVADLCGAGQE